MDTTSRKWDIISVFHRQVELNVMETFLQKLLGAVINVVSQGSYFVRRSPVTEKDQQGLISLDMCILRLSVLIAEFVQCKNCKACC